MGALESGFSLVAAHRRPRPDPKGIGKQDSVSQVPVFKHHNVFMYYYYYSKAANSHQIPTLLAGS